MSSENVKLKDSENFNSNVAMTDDIQRHLSTIKELVRFKDLEKCKSANEILTKVLEICPFELLDELIMMEVLPVARQILLDIMDEISGILKKETLPDNMDRLRVLLSMCTLLMEFWEKSIERVRQENRTIPVSNVERLFENTLQILIIGFNHCKFSQQNCGSHIDKVSAELTILFRKVNGILNLFVTTLDNTVSFSTDNQSEMNLLVKVIEIISVIVMIVREMDTKCFLETSKVFGKMAMNQTYDSKRDKLSSIVISYIEDMSKVAITALSKCMESLENIDKKLIKCWSFQLKILERLCMTYKEYLFQDHTMRSLFLLIIQLYKCSSVYLKTLGLHDETTDKIFYDLYVTTKSLMDILLENKNFRKLYFEYECIRKADTIAYYLLTLDILTRLISMPYKEKLKWFFGVNCIFDLTLRNINALHEEIIAGQLRLPTVDIVADEPSEKSESIALYDSTLILLWNLISQVEADEFRHVEELLLKHLLHSNLWASLLSADLWCFMDRFTFPELCYEHVRFLFKCYALLFKQDTSLNVIMLEHLISRLYIFLSDAKKISLVEEFCDFDILIWSPLLKLLPVKAKEILHLRLKPEMKKNSKAIQMLHEKPSIETWHQFNNCIMGNLLYDSKENMPDFLQLWLLVQNAYTNCGGKLLSMLTDFIRILLRVSQPTNSDLFIKIIKALSVPCLSISSCLKLELSYYFQDNVLSFDLCESDAILTLAQLISDLLCDENPLVQQAAFESFDFVARICPNDELVAKMATVIANKPQITDIIEAYLNKVLYYKDNLKLGKFEDYLRHSAKRCPGAWTDHRCYYNDGYERDEKIPKLEHIIPLRSQYDNQTSYQANQRLSNVCNDLREILKHKDLINNYLLQELRDLLEVVDTPTT